MQDLEGVQIKKCFIAKLKQKYKDKLVRSKNLKQ